MVRAARKLLISLLSIKTKLGYLWCLGVCCADRAEGSQSAGSVAAPLLCLPGREGEGGGRVGANNETNPND